MSETLITVEYPPEFKRQPFEIPVPFSEAEISIIKRARDLINGAVICTDTGGSSRSRELKYSYGIPWGYTLQNRQSALLELANTLQYCRSCLYKWPPNYTTNVKAVFEELANLLSLLF